jgi:large subunit ribosomal protein L25
LVAGRPGFYCKETMMKTSFELIAEFRDDQGKGASRRLRHAGRVPAILYGGQREPRALSLDHTKLQLALENEKFYSSIMELKVGEQTQAAILRDVQRHPWKNQIVHIDLQRVSENETIRLAVPLHYTGEAAAPGVKTEGGMMSHLKNELMVECLPKDLPEYLEVDVSGLHLNQSLHVSDIKLPQGVASVELQGGKNPSIVAVHAMRAEEVDTPVVAAAEGAAAAAAPAAGAAPAAAAAAPGDKKPAEAAKKEEPKKDAKK